MRVAVVVVLLAVLAVLAPPARTARILGLFPHPGRTHFIVFEPLMRELAARGHDVVVVSHFPLKDAPRNYRDISLLGTQTNLEGKVDVEGGIGGIGLLAGFMDFIGVTAMGNASCEAILSHPPVRELLRDPRGFDLIIKEAFNTNCMLGLVHGLRRVRPDTPYIGISSCAPFSWDYPRVGSPFAPAVMPNTFLSYSDEMTFGQRLANTLFTAATNAVMLLGWDASVQAVAERHLGAVPPLRELAYNMSLFLVNMHPALTLPKPLAPGIVEVGGIHIGEVKALPKDLEQFVSGAKDGVIVFSLGSMIRTSSLPKEHGAALLKALGTLKQRVLWKWEDEAPGPVPKNVRLLKWMPQFDTICHNNTRLFIGHGGLLSTSEAAHCGVPLLGIAMYGDQRLNLAAIAKAGAGRSVPYATLKNADLFIKNVRDMLEDPSYRENAKVLSARYRDRPMSPLETAVYWTEYVIRHKGAPHLRGAARNLAWWQEALLDVMAVVALGLAAALYVLWVALRALARIALSMAAAKKDPKKKKA